MKYLKSYIFSLLIIFSTYTQASLLVEPHLGYNLIGIGQNTNNPATTVKYNGLQYGLRTGATYAGFMGGLDYNHSSFDQLTTGYSNKFSRTEVGIFVGYSFPILVRAWSTYNFSYAEEAKSSSTLITSGSKYQGHSIELGAGYVGFPNISLNISMRMITLDEYFTSTSTTSLTGSNIISAHETVLGISAPFSLF